MVNLKYPLDIGYHYFRKLALSMNSDNVVDQLPVTNEGKMMTHTVIKYTVTPPEQRSISQALVLTTSDPSSDNETELSSDEGEAHDLDEDPNLCCGPFYCSDCGRLFLSENYLKNHIGTKGCRPIENNMTIEGRAIRMLEKKLTDKTTVVHSRNDSITHVAPRNALTN